MSSINNDPIDQALIEQDPKGILLQTAIDISQFRANTAQGRNPYCKIQNSLQYIWIGVCNLISL